MAKIIFTSRDELTAVDTDKVAFIQANGNYSKVVYINRKEVLITLGISIVETTIKSANDIQNKFVRLGRSVIVNHKFLHRIDLVRQLITLWDGGENEIRLKLPKTVLKVYKEATAKSFKLLAQNGKN